MKKIQRLINKVIRILYPRKCMGCSTFISIDKDAYLCDICYKDFQREFDNACQICGRNIQHKGRCLSCNTAKLHFDKGYSVLVYKNSVREAILKFKYKGKFNYAQYLGKILCSYCTTNSIDGYDYITAVPLHKDRYKQRGYNQAKLLGKILAKHTNTPYKDLLIRYKNTLPQNALNKSQREKNIKNSFGLINNINLHSKNILIVDDIFTTGSTINECAKILKKNGANSVDFICLSCQSND